MAKTWPAADVSGADTDRLLAELDAFSPTAVEELPPAIRVFFPSTDIRNSAVAYLADAGLTATAVDVPDDDWARRSQENLTPITVGRLIVTPPWHVASLPAAPALPALPALVIVIEPSMGFGTGHHATTRLCLAALQAIDVHGADVLDVGTGSGVLAIAARILGAKRARGIDNDPDAIQSAQENLDLNPDATGVSFTIADVSAGIDAGAADVVTANLTGALLERTADALTRAVRPGGTMIVSGLMVPERTAVEAAFSNARLMQAWQEDEWAALLFRR